VPTPDDVGTQRAVLDEQRRYYEARAPEYDDWFYRRGRYDRGAAVTATWFDEVDQVRTRLAGLNWAGRRVLELAPGTGIWTRWLLEQGAVVSAVDGSPAMVAVLAESLGPRAGEVNVEIADLFEWAPSERYDGVFFGFFLSHVPRARLADFVALVAAALAPGGVVGFVDSLAEATSTAADHILPGSGQELMTRRLDDGREFRIVKNFYEPAEIEAAAAHAGLALSVTATATYFLVGEGSRT
jgi:demethylmenaquinone methyltransferase/2-methoxy-6-polyprenyl-1,4-benzoquinol methylase